MSPEKLQALLRQVSNGELQPEDAAHRLRQLPFEDVGIARLDHHRHLRQGAPEVILGEGKTPQQVALIAERLVANGANVLCTRASPEHFDAVQARLADARYHETARVLMVERSTPTPLGSVAVVCAGTSDLPVAEEAVVSARFFGAQVARYVDVGVAGLHRLLAEHRAIETAQVVIVVAGMEGALPSVVGGLVAAPVIAVPTSTGYGAALGGWAALLGMLSSCARGLTVVNIDNGFGAAAAALRILQTQIASAPQGEV